MADRSAEDLYSAEKSNASGASNVGKAEHSNVSKRFQSGESSAPSATERIVMMRGVVSEVIPCFLASTLLLACRYGSVSTGCEHYGADKLFLQVWRAGKVDTRLWQDMMKFWPATFEGALTQPQDALVAHAGMHK